MLVLLYAVTLSNDDVVNVHSAINNLEMSGSMIRQAYYDLTDVSMKFCGDDM